MSKMWDIDHDFKGHYVEIPTFATWMGLSLTAIKHLYQIHIDAYKEKPTTIMYDSGDVDVATLLRHKFQIDELLKFWVPIPGMRETSFILASRKGFTIATGG